jgi:Ca2+-binding RTX toxin-like protein
MMPRWRYLGMAVTLALVTALVTAASAPAKVRCAGKVATVVGTGGDDRIRVPRKGNQVIAGLGGNDVIFAFDGKDRVCGNDGNDRIFSGPGADNVLGGAGNDLIDAGVKQDRLRGNGGDDQLVGGDGADNMFGDAGNDLLRGGSGAENAHGGSGDDRVQGDLLDDFIFGDAGADVLVGGQGIDLMKAGSGDDVLRGGTNQDDYRGEAGIDTASFVTAIPNEDQPGVTVDLADGKATGDGGRDDLSGIENVLGSTFTDEITGNGADNGINAGPGTDTVDGAGGSDVTDGGPGNDSCSNGETVLRCGQGMAEAPPDPAPTEAFVWLNEGGPDPGLLLLGKGTGAMGGPNDDLTISATASAYLITSPDPGAIVAYAGGACTTTGSGASCPKPAQPLAYIIFFGDEGNDELAVSGSNFPTALTTDLDGGEGSDGLTGSPGDDVIFSGDGGVDTLRGGRGSDALISEGAGSDDLLGEAGDDQLVTDDPCQGHRYAGGAGFDIAGFGRYDLAISGSGSVRAKMGGTATDPNRPGCKPTTIGSDLEILEGSAGDDTLLGSNRPDFLILGREGDDVIRGAGGPDLLLGNGGADSLFGDAGFDSIDAKDGERDRVINCGPGGGEAKRDPRDPRALRCR